MTEYQIEFSIQQKAPGDEDFTEIGFGSSGAWGHIDSAVHIVASMVQNREWETHAGMPEPEWAS